MRLVREKPGIVAPHAVWVFLDEHGYVYIDSSLLRLLWTVITEWRQDKHLVGY